MLTAIATTQIGLSAVEPTNSRALEIKGHLEFDYVSSTQKVVYNFSLKIDGDKAIVRTLVAGNTTGEYMEFRSNGKDSSFLHRYKPGLIVSNVYDGKQFVPVKTPQKPANQGLLEIHRFVKPTIIGGISPVWLAFRPKTLYRDVEPGDELENTYVFLNTSERDVKSIEERAYMVWNKDNPELLDRVIAARRDFTLRARKGRSDVFTNGIFQVTKWREIADKKLPEEFEMQLFTPALGSGPNWEAKLGVRVAGKVKEFSSLAEPIGEALPAEVGFPVQIIENRWKDDISGSGVNYLAKEGKVLNEPAIAAVAHKKEMKRLARLSFWQKNPMALRTSLLALLAATFLAHLVYHRRGRLPKQQTIEDPKP